VPSAFPAAVAAAAAEIWDVAKTGLLLLCPPQHIMICKDNTICKHADAQPVCMRNGVDTSVFGVLLKSPSVSHPRFWKVDTKYRLFCAVRGKDPQ
jgi:hypothetical protein